MRLSGRRLAAVVAVHAVLLSWPALAAAQPRDPVGGLAIDLRAVTVSLPTTSGWTPTTLTSAAVVPSRGWGGEAGAHLIFGPGRHRRLGLGFSGLVGQGKSSSTDGSIAITTRITAVAPHASWNFGHRLGWSYLSGGAGLARVTSVVDGGPTDPSGWGSAFHYGGGARWFVRERIAVSLDLRFWALTPRAATAERPRGAATTRVAFGVGVAVR